MYTAAIAFSITETIILLAGAIILGVAIHFFLQSRKVLLQTMAPQKKKVPPPPAKKISSFSDHDLFALPQPPRPGKAKKRKGSSSGEMMSSFSAGNSALKEKSGAKEQVIDSFKETVLQQQKSLSGFLQNMETLQGDEYIQLQKENTSLKKTITQFEAVLEKKEAEVEGAKQQAAVAQKMAARIEEVYKEFDYLQDKIADLEKQSRESHTLALELEDVKQLYEQLKKEHIRKQAKLEEIIIENQRLHHQLSETEDKLAEANFQRQHLVKKTQMMQEMNDDMQQMADTNKKLQVELRRIGELESMLNTMEEERTLLLKQKF